MYLIIIICIFCIAIKNLKYNIITKRYICILSLSFVSFLNTKVLNIPQLITIYLSQCRDASWMAGCAACLCLWKIPAL